MNASLIKSVQDIRGSYWFLPTLMAIASIGLSVATTHIDTVYGADWLRSYSWLYYNQAEGARATLTAIAGSMITVAGVTFSMTMVAVSFASAQFGPRLIGNFMRDRGNQVTLGTFIATFVYSLLVLRSVRGAEHGTGEDTLAAFVPHLSVLTAIVLALASVAVLIYFIHHIPETINIGNITAKLGADLKRNVTVQFPEGFGCEESSVTVDQSAQAETQEFASINSRCDGYLQAIDENALLRMASKNDVVVRIQCRPGDFVVEGSVLAEVRPADKADEELDQAIHSCFATGLERTATQDMLFLVDQLVEIMARALSPGVNDPFTASNCIDWLRAALHELMGRKPPEAQRYDADGNLRVVVHPVSFETFTSSVFDQSREYVASDLCAAIQTMSVIGELAAKAKTANQREVLASHAEALAHTCKDLLPGERSRQTLARRYGELQEHFSDPVSL